MKIKIALSVFAAMIAILAANSFGQDMIKPGDDTTTESAPPPESAPAPATLTLVAATMCESVENLAPHNQAAVFSISVGSVSCFTLFDPVPETTVVYHKWYKRDRLSTTQRLTLEPPKWRTYSSIYLREADKGPWRVEIVDPEGGVLKVLRFSITE
jgi:hypothetical protein